MSTARGRRRPAVGGADVDEQAAPVGPLTLHGGGLWAEVAGLPEKQRAALVLRYALDLRHREIGEVLGCSEAAARRNVHEGLTRN